MYQSDLKHSDKTLEEKLCQLYGLNRAKAIDLSFRPPFLNLLEKLGNPHLHLPPIIHVAGTNGKGSIIAMLRSILEQAGYNVHAYTSPHLMQFNERIVLAGEQISDEMLEDLIDEALLLNDGGEVTFFEITTAIAFVAFARNPADVVLLEVGMGGRLDCTNVIESPLLSIINRIGLDHTEHLGETYAQIAGEKAGILKTGVPCVIGMQSEAAIAGGVMDVFENKAREVGATLYPMDGGDSGYETALIGPYQRDNMAVALKALELIADDFSVSEEHIREGLKNASWRGRLQKLDDDIWLDGGHNADAALALAEQLERWKADDEKSLALILGMMKGKDVQGFMEPLLPFVDRLYLTEIPNEPNMMSAEDLQKIFPDGQVFCDYKQALSDIQAHGYHRILICGSLYLAGHVLGSYT